MLSSPITLPCGLTLKNRFAKGAMTENLADEHSRATQRHCSLYQCWAEGGAALLITGNVQIDRRFLERPGNICMDGPQDEQQMKALRALAVAASVNGTLCFPQLGHAGRQSTAKVNKEPVGPSAVPLQGIPSFAIGHPRALAISEVLQLPAKYAEAARCCEAAGFSGVQIHAAHGYLLSSFMNPRANQREDDYGGSLENRTRLLRDVVRAVVATVTPAFAISVKLNTADFQKGGFEHTDAIKVACMLAHERVDLLELSGGNYEMPTICGNKASVADPSRINGQEAQHKAIQDSTRLREAYYLLYCRDVGAGLRAQARAEGLAPDRQMKLMLTGGFRSRGAMEAALNDGDVDVIGVGRPLCGDPSCINSLLNGRIDTLPTYEDQLMPGGSGTLGGLFRSLFGRTSIGKTLLFATTQSWYYVNIYNIADKLLSDVGSVDRLGCLAAALRNEKEEGRIASGLVGVDCVGTHYAGLPEKRESGLRPMFKVFVCVAIAVVLTWLLQKRSKFARTAVL